MRSVFLRSAGLASVWLVLVGPDGPAIAFGVVAIAVATLLSLHLAPVTGLGLRMAGIPAFAWFFARESLRGGIDVARRAMSPRPRIDSTYLVYRASLPAGASRALFVALIGLMPGTVAVRLDDRDVLVHVLDRELAREDLLAELERRVEGVLPAGRR